MGHDVFISYSRKDTRQAQSLAERLTRSGITVWIDQRGIDAATNWSNEIVEALDQCKALLIILSENSVSSTNVLKELKLATEAEKCILPVDLEDVKLPSEFRYALAGVQRTTIADFEAILHSLNRFGIATTGNEGVYYKQQLDELTRAHHKCDYIITELRMQLAQRSRSFEALSHLQKSLPSIDGLARMIECTITEVQRSFGADRTVGFVRVDQSSDLFHPICARGYASNRSPSTSISFSNALTSIVVNGNTKFDHQHLAIREVLGLPYFAIVPIQTSGSNVGLLAFGRIQERQPYALPIGIPEAEGLALLAAQISSALAIRSFVMKEGK